MESTQRAQTSTMTAILRM